MANSYIWIEIDYDAIPLLTTFFKLQMSIVIDFRFYCAVIYQH